MPGGLPGAVVGLAGRGRGLAAGLADPGVPELAGGTAATARSLPGLVGVAVRAPLGPERDLRIAPVTRVRAAWVRLFCCRSRGRLWSLLSVDAVPASLLTWDVGQVMSFAVPS